MRHPESSQNTPYQMNKPFWPRSDITACSTSSAEWLPIHFRVTSGALHQASGRETDEIYVGINRFGAHFVFPVQAKAGKEGLNFIQIEQDIALCKHKFPNLICRPIGAQFLANDVIVLYEFREMERAIKVISEEHYRLVPPDQITPDDLKAYAELVEKD
jgi:hypothetical protein